MRSQLLAFGHFGTTARHKRVLVLGLVISALGPDLSLSTQEGTFTTFDVPGDVFGTFAYSINPAGTIAGTFGDAN